MRKNVDLSSDVSEISNRVYPTLFGKISTSIESEKERVSTCDRLFVSFTDARLTMKFLRQIKRFDERKQKGNEKLVELPRQPS